MNDKKMRVIVTGMHRSGTSAVAGALHHAGLPMGGKFIQPGADNPKGFFEDAEVLAINKELLRMNGGSWEKPPAGVTANREIRDRIRNVLKRTDGLKICGWKDPRFCFTLPIWTRLMKDRGYEIGVIYVRRAQAAVIESLLKRNGRTEDFWLGVIRKYQTTFKNFEALGLLRGNKYEIRFAWSFARQPKAGLNRIADWLGEFGAGLDVDAGAAHVDREMFHHESAKGK